MNLKEKDTFKTLNRPGPEVLYKEKNSKFYGYSFPLESEEDIGELLKMLKERQRKANHLCYAWQWGITSPSFRVQDDGEPAHSAGMPIYGQIQAFELTNVLVAVLRIYGGTKLGVGGLIKAYKHTAKLAIESAKITTKTIKVHYQLEFTYPILAKVRRILAREGIEICSQELTTSCRLKVAVPKRKCKNFELLFQNLPGIKITHI